MLRSSLQAVKPAAGLHFCALGLNLVFCVAHIVRSFRYPSVVSLETSLDTMVSRLLLQ